MSVPAKDKTWAFAKNQLITAQGTGLATAKRILRTEKNSMLAFASNPFTVKASCNGVTAGNLTTPAGGDLVDRWTTDADIVFANAGSAHSWFVFKMPGNGSAEVLISCEQAAPNGDHRTIYLSPANGFTGGSTTARPTATDEVPIVLDVSGWAGSDATFRLQQLLSTDGKEYRMGLFSGGALVAVLFIGRGKPSPIIPAGWTNDIWGYAATGATALDYNILSIVAAGPAKSRAAGVTMSLFFTGEGWGSANFLGVRRLSGPNELTSSPAESPLPAMGLASETSGCSGRHAEVYDVRWAITANANNTTYPEDASNLWAQWGDVAVPNDGTPYLLS